MILKHPFIKDDLILVKEFVFPGYVLKKMVVWDCDFGPKYCAIVHAVLVSNHKSVYERVYGISTCDLFQLISRKFKQT